MFEENTHIFQNFWETKTEIPFNEGVHSSGAFATEEDKNFVQPAVADAPFQKTCLPGLCSLFWRDFKVQYIKLILSSLCQTPHMYIN